VGQGERHLSFRVRHGSTFLKAIAFGMADRVEELLFPKKERAGLAFTPKINEWQGRRSVDLVGGPISSPARRRAWSSDQSVSGRDSAGSKVGKFPCNPGTGFYNAGGNGSRRSSTRV